MKNRNLREYECIAFGDANQFSRLAIRERETDIYLYMCKRPTFNINRNKSTRCTPFQIVTASDNRGRAARPRWRTVLSLPRSVIIAQKEATKLSASPSSMIRGYLMSSVNSFPRTHILGRELADSRMKSVSGRASQNACKTTRSNYTCTPYQSNS